MFYLETSVLVSALTREPQTLAWLADERTTPRVVSAWSLAELSSALSIKLRQGHLTNEERTAALAEYGLMTDDGRLALAVTDSDFKLAAQFCDRHDLGLRAADALHLAIAYRVGTTLCTRDRRQAEAGAALGIATELLA